MHVAICDDNVADRKHLERLLSRESDKRAGTPDILYIESFGDKEHFLKNPLKYNIVFMDMCSEDGLVEEIIRRLEMVSFNAPLILYSSKIDYTALKDLPPYVVHAKKPYIPDPLPGYLTLGDKNVIGRVVTLPFYQNGAIQHVPKDDIMYALPSESGYVLYLADSTRVNVDDDIAALRKLFDPHEEYAIVNTDCFVNFKYVSSVMLFSILMHDRHEFKISPFIYRKYKWLKEDINALI